MNQILHIFKKDTRHLLYEILASLLITAAFVCLQLRINPGTEYGPLIILASNTLKFVVPITWWVLIARLIHDESLIGSNQFWITRPYQWKLLLAAKLLFLAVFVYLPVFLTQSLILHHFGFNAVHYLAGLFFGLLLATCFLVLPLIALATITSNFAKMTLALLGVFLYFIFYVLLVANFSTSSAPQPHLIFISLALLFVFLSAIILTQYARRNLKLALQLLAVLAIVFGVTNYPWPSAPFLQMAHRIDPNSSPAQISFDPDPSREGVLATFINAGPGNHTILLAIPVQISGIVEGQILNAGASRISIDTPSGIHWTSKWSRLNLRFTPETGHARVDIPVSSDIFEKIKGTPVNLRLNLALTQLQSQQSTRVTISDGAFTLPDGGVCSTDQFSSYLECNYAMRVPEVATLTTRWGSNPCSSVPQKPVEGTLGYTQIGSTDTEGPGTLDLDPIKTMNIRFSNNNSEHGRGYLCPGASIDFTQYKFVRRLQTEVVMPNLQIPATTLAPAPNPRARSRSSD